MMHEAVEPSNIDVSEVDQLVHAFIYNLLTMETTTDVAMCGKRIPNNRKADSPQIEVPRNPCPECLAKFNSFYGRE